jgi:hypothetical protein
MPPPYDVRFQMHWDSKMLLHCPPQGRQPLLYGHFFIAEGVAMPYKRGTTVYYLQGHQDFLLVKMKNKSYTMKPV